MRSLFIPIFALAASPAAAHLGDERASPDEPPQVQAPGEGLFHYSAPPPGTYSLPPLKPAGNGAVLTSEGVRTSLHDLYRGKIVLLSLIYTSCSDASGCPLASAVLRQVQRRLGLEAETGDKVMLLSLSFDPQRDRPEVMRRYGAAFAGNTPKWRFLTAGSESDLAPILANYGQSVIKERDTQGNFLGTFSHVLRVFLIDAALRVRNIYSASFLHVDTLVNDVKTLMLEQAGSPPPGRRLQGAGDEKSGYESPAYRTRSRSLQNRTGRRADLLAHANAPILGLPAVPAAADNALTSAKIALGRKLFFDRRLSHNNTFSCAMCHIPEQGFTSNELATAVGVEGRTVRRNSPSLYNVAYMRSLFHDGRETTLEHQVWGPLLARNEMANPSIGFVIEKLKRMPDYDGLFERAFAGRVASVESVGMAIASYERTLRSGGSAFDRWHYGKDQQALSDRERRGFALFTGKARCNVCHLIDKEFALFTDNRFHNTGIGYAAATGKASGQRDVLIAPGLYLELDADVVADASEPRPSDLGRYEITQDPADRWKYKTPSLRNVALTAPYMHDGSLRALRDVVEYYNRGGIPNEGLDPLIRPLTLSHGEIDVRRTHRRRAELIRVSRRRGSGAGFRCAVVGLPFEER